MKIVLIGSFIILTLLSVAAGYWTPAKPDNRIELVWVTDNAPTRYETMNLFNSTSSKYRVVLDYQNGTPEKIIVQSLAGVGPDVFDCYDTAGLVAYVKADIAYDCTDDFKKRGIDLEETWSCLKPLYLMNGRTYAHPTNASAPAIWFNKQMFDEAGVPYPRSDWTWDEFIVTAQKLTKQDARGKVTQYGFLGPFDLSEYRLFWGQWNARVYNESGTRCMLDRPEAAEAIQFMQDLIYKHHVAPSLADEYAMASSGGWGIGALPLFAAGKGAMAIGGRWWLVLLRNKDYAHLTLGATCIPRGPSAGVIGYGKTTVVNKYSKHLDGALAFLQFLHSREYTELINRQADGIGPLKQPCYTDAFLHNPAYPDEDYNDVWRDTVANSFPMEGSQYVNGKEFDIILGLQADLIKVGKKTGAEAMRDLASKINESIVKQLRIDPTLKARYMEAVREGAPTAWDRPEDAP